MQVSRSARRSTSVNAVALVALGGRRQVMPVGSVKQPWLRTLAARGPDAEKSL